MPALKPADRKEAGSNVSWTNSVNLSFVSREQSRVSGLKRGTRTAFRSPFRANSPSALLSGPRYSSHLTNGGGSKHGATGFRLASSCGAPGGVGSWASRPFRASAIKMQIIQPGNRNWLPIAYRPRRFVKGLQEQVADGLPPG